MKKGALVLVWVMVASCFCWDVVGGQLLSSGFYDKTCPTVQAIVRNVVKQAVVKDKRMAASLLRLHFHDCFVNGCDASILLDDTSTFTGEKSAGTNANSIRGYEVIDSIKSQLESRCSGVVSCADIVTIAARDAVVEAGGQSWTVLLGRRDSASASLSAVAPNIPSPFSDLSTLISNFKAKGLSEKEMVVLSGAHTFGLAKCSLFRNRIYTETNIDPAFAKKMQARCPSSGGDTKRSPLDFQTPNVFDNVFYKNLQAQKGLFHSDQVLFNNDSADPIVNTYAANQATFFSDFAAAMIKLGNIQPLTGTAGQIRKNCRKAN